MLFYPVVFNIDVIVREHFTYAKVQLHVAGLNYRLPWGILEGQGFQALLY